MPARNPHDTDDKKPAKPSRLWILLLVLVIVALGVGYYMWSHRGEESTDDATVEAHVVAVAPNVSGYVTELNITDNQHVKAGEVLLRIDPANYVIARDKAQAQLEAAQARLSGSSEKLQSTNLQAPSALANAQSQITSAKAEFDLAHRHRVRLENVEIRALSRQEVDDARTAEKTAQSKLAGALAMLDAAKSAPNYIAAAQASVEELKAGVTSAQADLAQAQKNLDDAVVVSPIDGKISRRSVEKGAYVVPGQQLLSVVGNSVWVVANFKETQLANMKQGQAVTIEVDAHKGTDLAGKVDGIQAGTGARFSLFPPENATGNFVKIVQRVPVKIILDRQPDPLLHIAPGMSVTPTVHTIQ